MAARTSLGLVVLGFALAAGAAAGCTKILGLDYTYEGTGAGGSSTTATTTGTGGAAMCGTFVWNTEASCQSCMQNECCGELLACTTGTPCATLATCAAKCEETDDACLGACLTTDTNEHQSSGADAYYALVSCFGTNCQGAGQCSFPVCNSGFTWSISACAECLSAGSADTGCCGALTTCDGDPVCSGCIENPSGATCAMNPNYPSAQACVSANCGQVCADYICTVPQFFYTSPRCNYCLSNATTGCCPAVNACADDTGMGGGRARTSAFLRRRPPAKTTWPTPSSAPATRATAAWTAPASSERVTVTRGRRKLETAPLLVTAAAGRGSIRADDCKDIPRARRPGLRALGGRMLGDRALRRLRLEPHRGDRRRQGDRRAGRHRDDGDRRAGRRGRGVGGASVCMPGAVQPCYDGPAGTEGTGNCQGACRRARPTGEAGVRAWARSCRRVRHGSYGQRKSMPGPQPSRPIRPGTSSRRAFSSVRSTSAADRSWRPR